MHEPGLIVAEQRRDLRNDRRQETASRDSRRGRDDDRSRTRSQRDRISGTYRSRSEELRKSEVSVVALTPGFLRSERMLEHFGVSEENWRDGAEKDPDWLASETPDYVGRAVAALAADPNVKERTGRVTSSGALARAYGFTDVAGRQPHWNDHFAKRYGSGVATCDDAFYAMWEKGPLEVVYPAWPEM